MHSKGIDMLEIQALTYNDLPPVVPVTGMIPEEGGTVGRGRENAVVLPDPMRLVSRQHLQFTHERGGSYRVSNISSANLVYVNDQELSPGTGCPIQDQDRIIIGGYVLRVSLLSSASVGLTSSLPASAGATPVAATAAPAGLSDDFLSSLLDPYANTGAAASSQDSGLLDLSDPFAQPVRTPSLDPIQALNERGVELDSFTGKGDGLINGEDASGMARELLRDPLSAQADKMLNASGLDPLAMFDADYGGGLSDILQSGKTGRELPSSAGEDFNHGSELEGLFRIPSPVGDLLSSGTANTGASVNTALLNDAEQFIVNFGSNVGSDLQQQALQQQVDTPPLSPAMGEPLQQPDSTAIQDSILPETFPAFAESVSAPQPEEVSISPTEETSLTAAAISSFDAQAAVRQQAILPDDFDQLLDGLAETAVIAEAPPAMPIAENRAETMTAPSSVFPVGKVAPSSPPAAVAPVAETRPAQQRPAATGPAVGTVAVAGEVAVVESSPVSEAEALYQALLEGMGIAPLPDRTRLDKDFIRMIGQLLRCYAQGTVELMAGRAIVKREVRASVTLIAPERNNPLKFSPDGEVALMYLLGRQFPGFMEPVEAVQHAFTDLRAHQVGIVSGMRSALNHVLDRFDPTVIDHEAARRGLIDSMLSVGRKARLWEAYGRYFQTTREDAEDRFQDFFGAAFLEAYENAISATRGNDAQEEA